MSQETNGTIGHGEISSFPYFTNILTLAYLAF